MNEVKSRSTRQHKAIYPFGLVAVALFFTAITLYAQGSMGSGMGNMQHMQNMNNMQNMASMSDMMQHMHVMTGELSGMIKEMNSMKGMDGMKGMGSQMSMIATPGNGQIGDACFAFYFPPPTGATEICDCRLSSLPLQR